MAALHELYQFEKALDDAFADWLTDNLGVSGVQILKSREDSTLQTPCIILRSEHLGAFSGHETQFRSHNGILKECVFSGRLTATIYANRGAGRITGADILAHLRASLYDCNKETGINTTLANHHLYSVLEEGTQEDERDEDKIDTIETNWGLIYQIEDASWP